MSVECGFGVNSSAIDVVRVYAMNRPTAETPVQLSVVSPRTGTPLHPLSCSVKKRHNSVDHPDMPWSIEQRDGRYCVIKDEGGQNEGCHDTRQEAEEHRKALYASEPKAAEDVVASMRESAVPLTVVSDILHSALRRAQTPR